MRQLRLTMLPVGFRETDCTWGQNAKREAFLANDRTLSIRPKLTGSLLMRSTISRSLSAGMRCSDFTTLDDQVDPYPRDFTYLFGLLIVEENQI